MRGLALLALLVPGAASARTLTPEEAVALALERTHSVRAAEAELEAAQIETQKAFMQFFPKVSATASYTYLNPVPYLEFDMSAFSGSGNTDACSNIDPATLPAGWTPEMAEDFCLMLMGWMAPTPTEGSGSAIPMGLADNYQVQLQVEQVLFAGGALHQSYQGQRARTAASASNLRLVRQTAAYDAEAGFYQLALARRAEEVTAEAQAMMEALVRDLSALVEVGMGARADLLAAEAQSAQARLAAMRAAHGADLAEAAYKVRLGLSQEDTLELVFPSSAPTLAEAREGLAKRALAHRADVAMLDHNLDALRHMERAALGSWLPALAIVGNLQGKNPNYAMEPEWYSSGNITLAASWNLWDRGAALQSARGVQANLRQLSAQRDLLQKMSEVEVKSSLSSFDEALAEVEVAAAGLRSAEEALRLETERNAVGMANTTQLLQTHTALSNARLSQLQAETQVHLAHAALRKAIGEDPKENP